MSKDFNSFFEDFKKEIKDMSNDEFLKFLGVDKIKEEKNITKTTVIVEEFNSDNGNLVKKTTTITENDTSPVMYPNYPLQSPFTYGPEITCDSETTSSEN